MYDSEIAIIFGLSPFIPRKTRRFSEIQIIKVWRLTLAEIPNVTSLVNTTHNLGNHFLHPNFTKCLWLSQKETGERRSQEPAKFEYFMHAVASTCVVPPCSLLMVVSAIYGCTYEEIPANCTPKVLISLSYPQHLRSHAWILSAYRDLHSP
jgi:hypothetical protein